MKVEVKRDKRYSVSGYDNRYGGDGVEDGGGSSGDCDAALVVMTIVFFAVCV